MGTDVPGPADIQPVVLAGGRSRRFGRDKLLEPWPGQRGPGVLIDRPVAALREVFGPRVWVVGDCSPLVAARADLAVPDAHPGRGPLGGVLAALARAPGAVFVLAGDLPAIDAGTVRLILAAAGADPGADAVLASAGRLEPCVGLYRASARPALEAALAGGDPALHRALAACRLREVEVPAGAVRNINSPADLLPAPPPAG